MRRLGERARTPVFLQGESAECGLACVAMVAARHGLASGLSELRARFAPSPRGTTLGELMRVCAALELATRPLRLEPPELARLELPCILHWGLDHFVVLDAVRRRGVVVLDPAAGRREVAWSRVGAAFTGVALEVRPVAGATRARPRPKPPLRALVGRVTGLGRSLAQIGALALALEASALAAPFLMQWLVDGALVSGDADLLTALGAGLVLLALAQTALAAMRSWALAHLSAHLSVQWSANALRHLLRLPPAWFARRPVGDVMARFGAIGTLQDALTAGLVEALVDGALALTALAMMLLYSPGLAAIVLAAAAAYTTLRLALLERGRAALREKVVFGARQSSALLETLRGIQPIKLYAREADRHARWIDHAVAAANRALALQRLETSMQAAQGLLAGLGHAVVLWAGGSAVMNGGMTLGMLLAFLAHRASFASRAAGLTDRLVEISLLRVHAERLADILFAPVAPEPASHAPAAAHGPAVAPARLEMREVEFRWAESDPPILRGCSLVVEPGERVALTGPSGCGKTTLLRIVLGLLAPSAGEVRLDGVRVDRPGTPRAPIAAVLQDDTLFAGSVAENIAFFDASPDPERIRAAAGWACVHEDILRFPMAYHTLVGEAGSALSGGQRQRLLLARALYRTPALLVLDEASSQLDVAAERAISANLRRLGVTVLMAAHRPETLAAADRVLVLRDGRIVREVRPTREAAPARSG